MNGLNRLDRRAFLDRVSVMTVVAVADPAARFATAGEAGPDPGEAALKWPQPVKDGLGEPFPSHDLTLAQEMVAVSHGNLDRVVQLVTMQPPLAKAAWDWGFGDWETALGAASHVGNRAIAEVLLKHGAPPTIFSAAMLGHLEVVKAFVAASPGIERHAGPHGITLLSHARAGREPATAVVAYLEGLGTADERPATEPLDAADRVALPGRYAFGTGPRDALVVEEDRNGLNVRRLGATPRGLRHRGGLAFSPVGADAVRLRFVRDASAAAGSASAIVSLTIAGLAATDDGAPITARKVR